MKLFSVDEVRSNRVARAINDVQRGLPIVINKEHLIVSIETLSEPHFNKLKQYFKDKLILVVPENKNWSMRSISQLCFKEVKTNVALLISASLRHTEHQRNISSVNETKEGQVCCVAPRNGDRKVVQLAKFFFKRAKLRPVFLLVELTAEDRSFLNEAHILNLEESDFNSYEKLISSNVEQVTANVSIQLKHSSSASVTMFRAVTTGDEHCAIVIGNLKQNMEPLVRIHSSCYTGDLLKSLQCDCNNQLHGAIRIMSECPENAGVIVYLAQEGRGIGLANKLRAYALQGQGYDTVEANEKLGFNMDERDYSIASEILKKLKITKARLLTNNPHKTEALIKNGIAISKILPLTTDINTYNEKYMAAKKNKMAHAI